MTQTAKDRVDAEYAELRERMNKLNAFLDTDPREKIGAAPWRLLCAQNAVMTAYAEILCARLATWKD